MHFIDYSSDAGPQGLRMAQTDAPKVAPGKVVIQVKAFGVNRADTLQRQGKYPAPPGESPILGLEAAGTVLAVGEGVSRWQCGDEIFGLLPGGGYAEQALVDEGHLMAIPDGVSMTHAAGLAEVFLTAYQALFTIAQVPPNGRALIHAGASGVGLAALQLCKLHNIATAVTASSADKLAMCEQMGAQLLINYKEQDFAEQLSEHWPEGVNGVVDFVGGDYLNRNLKCLAQDGHIVYLAMLAGRYADKLDMALMLGKRATITGSTLRSRTDAYKRDLIAQFSQTFLPAFADGRLQVNVDTVLPVSDISQAHQRLEDNQTQGKLIAYWP